jgi:tetratricopeptide (TPR) repeat protein
LLERLEKRCTAIDRGIVALFRKSQTNIFPCPIGSVSPAQSVNFPCPKTLFRLSPEPMTISILIPIPTATPIVLTKYQSDSEIVIGGRYNICSLPDFQWGGGAMKKRRTYCRILVLAAVISLAVIIPQQVLAQTNKGIELYNQWQFADAEKALREALKADPSETLANYYLGLSVLMQEKYNEAVDIFLKVKRSQDKADQWSRPAVPSEYQIQLATARARLGLGQFDEAWKNLESARIEDGKASDVYVYRGQFYVLQKKNSEAIKELEKAIKLDDKNAYAYYYLGFAYYQAGQPDKAVTALKMFLQLNPNAPDAPKAKKLVDQLC